MFHYVGKRVHKRKKQAFRKLFEKLAPKERRFNERISGCFSFAFSEGMQASCTRHLFSGWTMRPIWCHDVTRFLRVYGAGERCEQRQALKALQTQVEDNTGPWAGHLLVHTLRSRIDVDKLGVQRYVFLVLGFLDLACYLINGESSI
jgi:hypothetical protein